MAPLPADLMTMWPIGRKVGKPDNNTPDILDPVVKEEKPADKPKNPDDDQPSLF